MSFVIHSEPVDCRSAGEVHKRTSFIQEAQSLINLTIPTVLIQIGSTVPPFLIASYVGRTYGSVYLDGFTLANLTMNLFTMSILTGLYSASDTLSPQAFGLGNEREVGLIAIRGFVASLMVCVPVNIFLFYSMDHVMEAIGEDPTASIYSWHWYRVYTFAIPFYALYSVMWKFLSAQHTLFPVAITSVVSSVVVLPVSLYMFSKWIGFVGTAVAVVFYYFFQVVFLLIYICWKQPHIPATWPGLGAWKEALVNEKFYTYMSLGAGGILAVSEWIYWETLSLCIGTLGVVELSVHTIPTQVLLVGFMIPSGIGIALSIRLGATLPRNVHRAKQLVWSSMILSGLTFGVVSVLVYLFRFQIFHIFTSEDAVIAGADQIWWKVCFYFFQLCLFALNIGVSTGLGMQWTLGFTTLFFLWIFGLPAAYYFAIYQHGGIDVAWTWIWPPYVGMNAVLMLSFVTKDWDDVAAKIRIREGIVDGELETLTLKESPQNHSSYGTNNVKIQV